MNARKAIHDLTAAGAVGFTLTAFLWIVGMGSEAEALPVLLLTSCALVLWAVVVASAIGEPK